MGSSIIQPEDYDKVISLLLNTNMPLIHIARKFGAKSKDSVIRVAKLYDIDVTQRKFTHYDLSIEQENQILDLYENNHYSCRKIAQTMAITEYAVKRFLHKQEVNIRQHYQNDFNEHYFDNIDCPNKAYLLGFLYADGCINKNNSVSIVIHEKDITILKYFQSELNATNEIKKIKNKPHVRIDFCSKHMCDALISKGCYRNKTFNCKMPNNDQVPKEFIWDFVRGFMDGDGSVSILRRKDKKYLYLLFVGTLEMMQDLLKLFQIDNTIYYHKNAYHLSICGYKAYGILQKIYTQPELFMKRKHDKYLLYEQYLTELN